MPPANAGAERVDLRMVAMSTSQGNARIRAHFPAFDLPLEPQPDARRFAIAFALRGIRYYGQTWDVAARWPEAGVGSLRSLIDLVILTQWVEGSPKLRLALYTASDDRDAVRVGNGYNRVRRSRGMPELAPFTPVELARRERRSHLVRRVAIARGTERLSAKDSDPLLPSIADRAELGGDALELYWMFQLLSQMVHVNGRAFVGDWLEARRDGTHLRPRSSVPPEMVCGLVVPALCMLLASASRQLGLGIESELDALRLSLSAWEPAQ